MSWEDRSVFSPRVDDAIEVVAALITLIAVLYLGWHVVVSLG